MRVQHHGLKVAARSDDAHWDAPAEIATTGDRIRPELVNMGISIVTPIDKVIPLAQKRVDEIAANDRKLILESLSDPEFWKKLISALGQSGSGQQRDRVNSATLSV